MSTDRNIHIVAFDIPFPPSYGGVIDIYFKLKSLVSIGIRVHLHCFVYGNKKPSEELSILCERTFYYERRKFKNPFIGDTPYIINTRDSEELLQNLSQDNFPILFEGLHCTYFLNHPRLRNRFKIVRTHNIEHNYYFGLEKVETNYFKKYFFRLEAERLIKYERILRHADLIAAISPQDTEYYKHKFIKTFYVPAFGSNTEVKSKPGKGKYILYHGNLAVGENNSAALYLVNEVFSKLNFPCKIAGNNPSSALRNAVKYFSHIELISEIDSNEILETISEAHINVLITFQNTGIKLKLLNALHLGRHCICNEIMVQQTGLEKLTHVANTPSEIITSIQRLWDIEFSKSELESRKNILLDDFSNLKNAQKLIDKIIF